MLDRKLGSEERGDLGKYEQVAETARLRGGEDRSDCHCWSMFSHSIQRLRSPIHRCPASNQQTVPKVQIDPMDPHHVHAQNGLRTFQLVHKGAIEKRCGT